MPPLAEATFEITGWSDTPCDARGPKLARATVTERFRGAVEGDATTESLVLYRDDGASASFVRMTRVVGRLGGREGTFVLQGAGGFEGATAKATLEVVPGSGTGGLVGLRGRGAFVAHHGEAPIEFDGRTWAPVPRRVAAFALEYDLA